MNRKTGTANTWIADTQDGRVEEFRFHWLLFATTDVLITVAMVGLIALGVSLVGVLIGGESVPWLSVLIGSVIATVVSLVIACVIAYFFSSTSVVEKQYGEMSKQTFRLMTVRFDAEGNELIKILWTPGVMMLVSGLVAFLSVAGLFYVGVMMANGVLLGKVLIGDLIVLVISLGILFNTTRYLFTEDE